MRYLLDTQAILWLRSGSHRLDQKKWAQTFNDLKNGKLQIDGTLVEFASNLLNDDGFQMLSIDLAHIIATEKLPLHHRDPFDRLLIAQAIELHATAVTNDPEWKKYPLTIQW